MTKVAASILSADFANLHKDCTRLLEAGADVMHFDVMDGHFVPNISYGAPVLTCLHAALPDVFYDVHLMISDPARYAADFAKAGANLITFHLEAVPDTVEEVIAAKRILQACGIRRSGVNLVSCPTCGRTAYDMIPIAEELERRLADCKKNITVAVMGCVVNGPGEASAADIGVAGGKGEGMIFRKGKILYKVPQEKLVDALMEEIKKL